MADDAAAPAADVQAAEITLDDFNADEQESPKATPSVADDKKPAPEVKEEAKAEPETPEAKEPEGEPEAKADDTVEPETPKGKAEERKAQLNTEIRDLVSQRNALKEEVTKANAEVYQPATEDELLGQINPETGEQYTRAEAKVDALDQRMQVRDYNDRVADAQLTISSEAERVLQDFPIFNSESKEYDKELSEEVSALLEANLILDPNTSQVIGSNVSPYKLYQAFARASGNSTVKGQMKGQQDTEQMLANADVGSSATVEQKPVDPLVALWQED